jgi:hypothetical protein
MNEENRMTKGCIQAIIIISLILAGIIYIVVKFRQAPEPVTADNLQLIEQIAMDAAEEFLENKELFLEYEPCEPMHSDSIFMDKLLPAIHGAKIVLYPVSYAVKIVNSPGIYPWNKDVYVSCEARVYSRIGDVKRGELHSTGLVFSESIRNKKAVNGVMEELYITNNDYGVILICVGIIFLFIYLKRDYILYIITEQMNR